MEKILLTGCTGMLGSEIYRLLNKKFEIYALSKRVSNKKIILKFDLKKKIINL